MHLGTGRCCFTTDFLELLLLHLRITADFLKSLLGLLVVLRPPLDGLLHTLRRDRYFLTLLEFHYKKCQLRVSGNHLASNTTDGV